jgi:trans-aconitate 2-methyltransferase
MTWNPDVYRHFEAERAAPFDDLMGLIAIRPGLRVLDLGCGDGALTHRLAAALPDGDVLGIDSSPEMLAQAQRLTGPGLRFALGTIESVTGAYDLVFSHSALQWVADHAGLIPRLMGHVAPGGQLAAQFPSNHDQPPHRLLAEVVGESPFQAALDGWARRSPVLDGETYARLLFEARAVTITVVEKVYPVVLEDAGALLEWARGTALVPYLDRLPEPLRDPFVARYREKLEAAFPETPVFYPFTRILLAATRPA